ncbi:MAG: helix-turn-helix transcriptional regulator [Ktedonobacterales bacterium]|nr:helix-turn-helix transcriptional regulator [Ktedonobacterales bacterium]
MVKAAGISRAMISRAESGGTISTEHVRKLAATLD